MYSVCKCFDSVRLDFSPPDYTQVRRKSQEVWAVSRHRLWSEFNLKKEQFEFLKSSSYLSMKL